MKPSEQVRQRGYDGHSPAVSPQLLDFFFGIAVILLLNAAGAGGRPPAWEISGVLTTILLTALWIWWRQCRQPVAAIAFALTSFVSYVIANSLVSVALQWVALIVLVLTLGRLAGYFYSVGILVLLVSVHVVAGSDLIRILSEALYSLLLVVAGMSFANLMKRSNLLDSERRRALVELETANAALNRSLRDSRDLALSRERSRVAAALHDGLGHRLTTVGLSLDFADRMLDRDPERAREEIRQARAAASEALGEMRATVRAMTPVELADGDIREALSRLAGSFAGTGLTADFAASGDREPAEDLNQLLLRFTQEALTNVIRHARADRVEIRFHGTHLSVADNGCGNDAPPGYGLESLARRAKELGAGIEGEPHGGIDGGFLITLELPEEA